MNKNLLESAKSGNFENVKRLLEMGADINTRNVWNGTPLYLACQHEHTVIVFYLLTKGANMHLTTDSGRTPLDIACTLEFEEIITILKIYDVETKIEPSHTESKHLEKQKTNDALLSSRFKPIQRIYSRIKHLFTHG